MGNGLSRLAISVLLAGAALPAAALDYELGSDVHLKGVNKFTLGAGIRMEGPGIDDLGKLNTPGQQTRCQRDDCLSFGVGAAFDSEPNRRLVNLRGGYFFHASDDGDMNYDKYDLFTGIAKLNADWTLNWGDWTFKTNFVGYFDAVNAGFEDHRNNTVACTGANPSALCTGVAGPNGSPDSYKLGPNDRQRASEIEHRLAVRGEFREYFVTHTFHLGDYDIFATLGNQRLRWGEANLTLLNTLDVVNPQDAVLARQPGLALNELNLPTGLLNIGSDIMEGLSVDGWYQYKWDPVRPEPAGSLFSNLSDAAGGGQYAVIALGQYPEDPDGLWFSEGVTGLISNSHRTVYIPPERSHAPKNSGQFGIRAKWYLPNFNNGTELGFYFANYHSRLPYLGVTAAPDSCLREAQDFSDAITLCHGFNAASNRGQAAPLAPTRCDPRGCNLGTTTDVNSYRGREPLPIDRMGVFLDFPENIQMYGVSFNTTLGGWSFAGEYSFRPNLPAQLLISDVVFAGLQPVLARQQLNFTDAGNFNPLNATDPETAQRFAALLADFQAFSSANGGSTAAANSALPAAQTIFPSYAAAYRGYNNASAATDINGGQYIPGYERLKVGQFALTALQLFSTNPFGSDDLLMVYEVGFTHVVDMPKQNAQLGKGLYFQGAGDQSHPSPGADGTGGAGQPGCSANGCEGRINPTQMTDGFADDFAWGLRALIQLNYSNLFDVGLTIKPTMLAFWDVQGTAPVPMQNYVEGNRWIVPALMFEYGSAWTGSFIYQYFGGPRSSLADRDNLSMSVTYAF